MPLGGISRYVNIIVALVFIYVIRNTNQNKRMYPLIWSTVASVARLSWLPMGRDSTSAAHYDVCGLRDLSATCQEFSVSEIRDLVHTDIAKLHEAEVTNTIILIWHALRITSRWWKTPLNSPTGRMTLSFTFTVDSFENSPINSVDGNARNNYTGIFNVGPNMQYIHLYVLCDDVTG